MMYINKIGHYIPSPRIFNDYFKQINGLESDWIVQRTGIVSRSKISNQEDITTMAIEATINAAQALPYDITEVDLIIAAGYSITDTVGTVAHRVQRHFNITNAQVFAVTSACSSLVNAFEIAQGYIAINKAKKILILCSEANSVYNDYTNSQSGHLWGDAAVAIFVTAQQCQPSDVRVIDINTKGLGHIGKGPDGVSLFANKNGIVMQDGKDVFHYACAYMTSTMEELLQRNQMSLSDVAYFACHQANLRIVNNIARQWDLPESKFFNNIKDLGNTGSASSMLALSQNLDKVQKGEIVGITVFGGGYSSGAMLIQF